MLSADVIESAEKRVGETIGGKWHLDRVIGVGGMAAVYEATHRNRNRVAIKLLHPPLSLDAGTKRRFLREGYVANTIRHSGAVQVLDDDVTDDGIAFLVMELLRGESVEERLLRKGGVLSAHDTLQMADQLLEVLEAAHDQNVVHRDIKPDNIFLTEEGKLKVLDFGIARLHQGDGRTTKVGSFMGTPAFCAQEQARGRWDEVDHRTDLYSVGASIFTCLTGTHVHEAETSSEQLALAIGATARSLGDVMPSAPLELVELVDTALAYDKEDRFQSARAMRAAVQRVKAGLPIALKVSTPPPPSAVGTFGTAELDPDSMPPTRLAGSRLAVRPLVGVLAATLLAVLIFFASKPGGETTKAGMNEERVGAPQEEEPRVRAEPQAEVLPPQRREESTVPAGVSAEVGEKVSPSAVVPRPSLPAGALTPGQAAPPSSPVRPPKSTASFPAPAPAPAPPAAGDRDEDMFTKRY